MALPGSYSSSSLAFSGCASLNLKYNVLHFQSKSVLKELTACVLPRISSFAAQILHHTSVSRPVEFGDLSEAWELRWATSTRWSRGCRGHLEFVPDNRNFEFRSNFILRVIPPKKHNYFKNVCDLWVMKIFLPANPPVAADTPKYPFLGRNTFSALMQSS